MVGEMAGEPGTVGAVGVEPGRREKASFGEGSVDSGGSMPLAEYKAIAIRPVGPVRIDAQDRPVQHRQQVRHREAAANVRRIGPMHHVQSVQSNALSEGVQLSINFRSQGKSSASSTLLEQRTG